MYKINEEDLSIYVTRGDVVLFDVGANGKDGKPYTFIPGDNVRIKVYKKKKVTDVVLVKEFAITTATQKVQIYLSGNETKFDEPINKPTTYWYEVVLNEDTEPQTIIGYDPDEGAKLFILLPEGATEDDTEDYEPGEDERYMDYAALVKEMAQLEYSQEQTHKAVAELHVTPQMYGAVGDGVADDTEAIQKAINSGSAVRLPAGEYIVGELVIDKNCSIYGDVKNKPTIKCRGIVLNGEVELSGLTILPVDGHEGTGVLVNKGGCEISDCVIYSFNIGLELSPTKHVVGGVFKNITIAYCKHAGVEGVASGVAQNNQILFEHLYIVKCGTDADNDTSASTQLEGGFGMRLDGGNGIEVRNCVFEYNTGVGLYLGQSYPLCGCSVTSPYFEHNKYAQLYVANSKGTYMRNVHISGDIYTDANRSLPADAMGNRTLYVENNGNLKAGEGDVGNYFSKETAKTYGYANRYCPQNVFPYDVIGELCNPHLVLGEYKGEKVWAIKKGDVMVYGCPIYVEKGEYKVTLDTATNAGTAQSFVIGLSNHSDGSKTWTAGASADWATDERTISFTKSGTCFLYASNANANGTCFVRNIRITRA